MKLVQDLPEIFEEFGEKRREAFLEVKEYKDKGVPVVGMYCAYFPTELAMAVGAIPVALMLFFDMKQLRQQSVNFLRVCVHL